MQERNVRMWDETLKDDPELTRIELGIARWGRILAADHESTPQYAEAVRIDRQLRDQRRELWERRAKKASA